MISAILRQRALRFFGLSDKGAMTGFQGFKVGCAGQVEAVPKDNDGTNNFSINDRAAFLICKLLSKVQGATRIGLPEINSVAKPVVFVSALDEIVASQ